MAPRNNLIGITLRVRDDGTPVIESFGRKTEEATERAGRGVSKFTRTTNQLRSVLAGLGAVGFARINFGFLREATRDLETYSDALSQVDTLLGGTGVSIEEIKRQLQELGPEWGDNRQQALALYQAISAGADPAGQAIEVVRQAAVFAKGSIGELEGSVQLLTRAVNNYGFASLTAAQAADAFTLIVRNGQTTANELNSVLGRVIATASAVQLPIETLTAVMGRLTLTFNSANAVTFFSAALRALRSPGEQAAEILDRIGLTADVVAEKLRSPTGFVEIIRTLQDAKVDIGKIFPAEASQAIDALGQDLAGLAEDIAEANRQIEQGGVAQEAAERRARSYADAVGDARNALFDFRAQVGEALVGDLDRFTGVITGLVDRFNDLSPAAQTVATRAFAVGGAIAAATAPLLLMAGAMGNVVSAASSVGISLGAVAASLGPIVIAAAAAAAALAGITLAATSLQEALDRLAQSERDFEAGLDGLSPRAQALAREFRSIQQAITATRAEIAKIESDAKTGGFSIDAGGDIAALEEKLAGLQARANDVQRDFEAAVAEAGNQQRALVEQIIAVQQQLAKVRPGDTVETDRLRGELAELQGQLTTTGQAMLGQRLAAEGLTAALQGTGNATGGLGDQDEETLRKIQQLTDALNQQAVAAARAAQQSATSGLRESEGLEREAALQQAITATNRLRDAELQAIRESGQAAVLQAAQATAVNRDHAAAIEDIRDEYQKLADEDMAALEQAVADLGERLASARFDELTRDARDALEDLDESTIATVEQATERANAAIARRFEFLRQQIQDTADAEAAAFRAQAREARTRANAIVEQAEREARAIEDVADAQRIREEAAVRASQLIEQAKLAEAAASDRQAVAEADVAAALDDTQAAYDRVQEAAERYRFTIEDLRQAAAGLAEDLTGDIAAGLVDLATGAQDLDDVLSGIGDRLEANLKGLATEVIRRNVLGPLQAEIEGAFFDVGTSIADGFLGDIAQRARGIFQQLGAIFAGAASDILGSIFSGLGGDVLGDLLGGAVGGVGNLITGGIGELLGGVTGALGGLFGGGGGGLAGVLGGGGFSAFAGAGATAGGAFSTAALTAIAATPPGAIVAAVAAIGTGIALAFSNHTSSQRQISRSVRRMILGALEDTNLQEVLDEAVGDLEVRLPDDFFGDFGSIPRSGDEIRRRFLAMGEEARAALAETNAEIVREIERGGASISSIDSAAAAQIFFPDVSEDVSNRIRNLGRAAGSALAEAQGLVGTEAAVFGANVGAELIRSASRIVEAGGSIEDALSFLEDAAEGLGGSESFIAGLDALNAQVADRIGALEGILAAVDASLPDIDLSGVGNLTDAFRESGLSMDEFLAKLREIAATNPSFAGLLDGFEAELASAASGVEGFRDRAIETIQTFVDQSRSGILSVPLAVEQGLADVAQSSRALFEQIAEDGRFTEGELSNAFQLIGVAAQIPADQLRASGLDQIIADFLVQVSRANNIPLDALIAQFSPGLSSAIIEATGGLSGFQAGLDRLAVSATGTVDGILAAVAKFGDNLTDDQAAALEQKTQGVIEALGRQLFEAEQISAEALGLFFRETNRLRELVADGVLDESALAPLDRLIGELEVETLKSAEELQGNLEAGAKALASALDVEFVTGATDPAADGMDRITRSSDAAKTSLEGFTTQQESAKTGADALITAAGGLSAALGDIIPEGGIPIAETFEGAQAAAQAAEDAVTGLAARKSGIDDLLASTEAWEGGLVDTRATAAELRQDLFDAMRETQDETRTTTGDVGDLEGALRAVAREWEIRVGIRIDRSEFDGLREELGRGLSTTIRANASSSGGGGPQTSGLGAPVPNAVNFANGLPDLPVIRQSDLEGRVALLVMDTVERDVVTENGGRLRRAFLGQP